MDMNSWLRQRAGYDQPDTEPVEETPPFNGGPRVTPPTPMTMAQLLRRAIEQRW